MLPSLLQEKVHEARSTEAKRRAVVRARIRKQVKVPAIVNRAPQRKQRRPMNPRFSFSDMDPGLMRDMSNQSLGIRSNPSNQSLAVREYLHSESQVMLRRNESIQSLSSVASSIVSTASFPENGDLEVLCWKVLEDADFGPAVPAPHWADCKSANPLIRSATLGQIAALDRKLAKCYNFFVNTDC